MSFKTGISEFKTEF